MKNWGSRKSVKKGKSINLNNHLYMWEPFPCSGRPGKESIGILIIVTISFAHYWQLFLFTFNVLINFFIFTYCSGNQSHGLRNTPSATVTVCPLSTALQSSSYMELTVLLCSHFCILTVFFILRKFFLLDLLALFFSIQLLYVACVLWVFL